MAVSHLHRRLQLHADQAPSEADSALIRDRLAVERQRLDAIEPNALDLAAEVLAALHAELRGELAGLAADRTPRYRRGQLLGENGLPIEDLAYLALQRPAAVSRALRSLLPDDAEMAMTLGEAGAQVAVTTGEFFAALIAALEDGRITYAEADQLDRLLGDIEAQARQARAALTRGRR